MKSSCQFLFYQNMFFTLSQWKIKVNVSFQRWQYYKGCDWDLLTKDELEGLDHKFRAHTSLAGNVFNCEDDKQQIWVKVELKCWKVTLYGRSLKYPFPLAFGPMESFWWLCYIIFKNF